MKKKFLIGVWTVFAVAFSGIGIKYYPEIVSFYSNQFEEITAHSNNPLLLNSSSKFIASGELPYLEELPILDNALNFKYYFNDLLFGGANIDLVKLAVRQQNGNFLEYRKNQIDHVIEFDITQEPYIESFYKNKFYSFSVSSSHHSFNYVFNEIKETTLIFDKENEIISQSDNGILENKKTINPEVNSNWILDNKEWLFSGLGIFIIGSIVQVIIYCFFRNSKIDKQIDRIVERYIDIIDGKISGHSGIPGLIECGAAELKRNNHLLKVGNAIKERGKPNPLEHWISSHIPKKEYLTFIKWQANNNIRYSPHYNNENTFKNLVALYNNKSKSN